ncbi:MAG: OadG family protein [Treponema sp.]|nr:OadG family protein [Treponema sp.]
MTIIEMLGQSAILTVLGIGVVFFFLIVMIICMNILHAVLHALKLDEEKKEVVQNQVQPAGSNGSVIAAIAAALHDKQ